MIPTGLFSHLRAWMQYIFVRMWSSKTQTRSSNGVAFPVRSVLGGQSGALWNSIFATADHFRATPWCKKCAECSCGILVSSISLSRHSMVVQTGTHTRFILIFYKAWLFKRLAVYDRVCVVCLKLISQTAGQIRGNLCKLTCQ